ncbi:aminotransferase class I/II-fold pyridoxal phosphate-dependent enzyme [Marivirga sp.]|uniref:threonine aldolase family protein n=1 Tax=Marivirga sp. TaxID=2018662 RepID=UPI0025D5A17B|nr:aminotransferase class I/II-fold pyridoxal phosphate-dependent enzyme [Marivirga sp.]
MQPSLLKNNRREFLKKLGLTSIPFILPGAAFSKTVVHENIKSDRKVNFEYDGIFFSPQEYIEKLKFINDSNPIEGDIYGNGGATLALEQKFAELTGKEKAIYLPTGTMANQLAIKLLSGEKTKVIVPENSHIYRDEADAAQSVHSKRLVPVRNNKAYFDASDLDQTINELSRNEVFKSGIGTVVVENPVRRADGTAVPLNTIKGISEYCKEKGYRMHLDAARVHFAEAFYGISVKEYASHFDTVYISLYKYLNAAGGAILCGDASLIDEVTHQIKIHGGTMYQTWNNTSMALHYLDGITARFNKMADATQVIVGQLNALEGVEVQSVPNGTNIYQMRLVSSIDGNLLQEYLETNHQISIRPPNEKGVIRLAFNESILFQSVDEIVKAFQNAISA